MYYIYSQPALLKEMRAAMSPYIHISPDTSGRPVHQVNIAEIIAGYPLLSSLIRETLRVQSTNATGRVILKDTLLEDQYLLKRDSILLISSAELHSDASVWGPSSKDFNPRRFIMQQKPTSGVVKPPASTYRAFGNGAWVCPGRYLAVNEIMIVLVIIVLRYDLSPVQGPYFWIMPKSRPHVTTSILTPVEDIQVTITEREGYEQRLWKFVWSASDSSPEPSL
jgi:cytochrome P450